jgi:ribose/xylose/arabinose/galactoside ABC-type transport system permease subunit
MQRPAVAEASRQDRLWPHLAWEAVLLLGVVATVAITIGLHGADVLTNERVMPFLLMQVAAIGLLASALSLSLRVAAPNLAVAAIAGAAGSLVTWLLAEHDQTLLVAALLALAAGAAVGLVLAMVVVGLHVPAWAVSLGAGLTLAPLTVALLGVQSPLPVDEDVTRAADQEWLWFGGFAAISVVGGALWAVPGIRRALSRTRADGDPARRPGVAAGLGAAVGLIGSSVLAAAAGVVFVLLLRADFLISDTAYLAETLAIVLLAGVSVFGRRGGVFGILLAACLVVLVRHAMALSDAELGVYYLVLFGAVVLGLIVSRLLELLGKPGPATTVPSNGANAGGQRTVASG